MSVRSYDAIVIGSGPAGSIAARELTARGLEVLLLEAGRAVTAADFKPPAETAHTKGIDVWPRVKAALHGQPIQARVAFFGPQFAPFFVNDFENPYTTPRGEHFLWIRGRQLGGRLHTYGRMLLRMSDVDFKAASRDGVGQDWPIAYADLEPWYDRIEQFMGVYGDQDNVANLPQGNYANRPFLTTAERALKASVESHWPERHVVSWRYGAPNLKRVPLAILDAEATRRLTIRTDAVVRRITVDDRTGRVTGAEFVDRRTRQVESATASTVVLCASTIESIRLLLNSACARHPNGLGNSSGLLGRYFMDQGSTLTFGAAPRFKGFEPDTSAPADPFYTPSGGFYIPRFQNLDSSAPAAYKRGFAYQGTMGRGYAPADEPAMFGMMGFAETLPYYDNTVTLNRRRRDRWGIPIPHIQCTLGPNEHALIHEMLRTAREIVINAGCEINFSGSPFGLEDDKNIFPGADPLSRFLFRKSFKRSLTVGAAIHECGGARMGADPATSVLDSFNRCWDAPNLFVTDGSCFPSSGTVGPALTIMAVTARACAHLADELKDGRM